MKAIILAGGEGTRLRPLTYEIPKALVSIDERNLTEHVIELLKSFGITDIVLSVSYKSEMVRNYFQNGFKYNVNINYVEEKDRLGTLGPLILLNQQNMKLDGTFMVLNGDNLFKIDFKEMLKTHRKNKALGTIALSCVNEPSAYGVAKLKKNKITEFVEKPIDKESLKQLIDNGAYWINGGYYLFEPEVFDIIKELDKGMIETFLFPELAKKGKLFGFKEKGLWFDTGTFDRLEKVRKNWT